MTEVLSQDQKAWDDEIDRIRKELDVENMKAMYHVDRGRQGLSKGMANGMTRLNKYFFGTHKGRYDIVAADSGVGKTTLTDFMYVYSLYKYCKTLSIPLSILYFSFEISVVMKKARWISLMYNVKYNEDMPSDVVYGWNPDKLLTDEQYARVKVVAAEVEEMCNSIQFVETSVTPYRMFDMMQHRAAAYGDFTKVSGANGPSAYVGYKNNKPDVVKVTIVDHLALSTEVGGKGMKYTMDLASTLFVKARNLWEETVVIVQQFNTDLQSAAREKKITAAYVPSRQDLGDSRYTYRDADRVLGLIRPLDYQLNEYNEYKKLSDWGQYFIALYIMKNRYGGGQGKYVPLFMNPIAGIPEELPSGNAWNSISQDLYIKKAETLDRLCQ